MQQPEGIESEVTARFRANLLRDLRRGRQTPLAAALEGFPPEHWEDLAREFLAVRGEQEQKSEGAPPLHQRPRKQESMIGPYRILRELGRGGQGAVWLAEDTRLHRQVALKLLSEMGNVTGLASLRFRREAEVASQLDHPGICTVYETGIEEGTPFIAMKYIEGTTVAEFGARGPASEKIIDSTGHHSTDDGDSNHDQSSRVLEVVHLAEKVARTLHAAHQAGVVHRDVKPSNIMVTPSGEPILMDFGLARQQDSDLPTLTRSGELFGTPAYLAPEQLTSQTAGNDPRSDVWALGVTLFELLTGRRPFESPTREGLYQVILTREPDDPRHLNPAVSRDLKVVLETALQKDRNRRYQSAQDLAEDLRRIREREPILARPLSTLGRAIRWARRKPALAALTTIIALGVPLVAGLGGFIVANLDDMRAGETKKTRDAIESLLESGFMQVWHGSTPDAEADFRAALDLGEVPEAVAGLAMARMRTGKPGSASRELSAHPAVMARHPELGWIRAAELASQGEEKEAERLQKELGSPDSPLAWFIFGTKALFGGHAGAPGEFEAAASAFRRASLLERRPLFFFEWAHALGHVLRRAEQTGGAGDQKGARVLAETLADLWPESPVAWFYAATLVCDDPAWSMSCYETVLQLDHDRADAHYNLAILQEGQNQVARAIQGYETAMRLAAEWHLPSYNLGVILQAQGRNEEAAEAYRETIRRRRDYVDAHINLGNVLADDGQLDEAEKVYRHVLVHMPAHAEALYNLGTMHSGRGQLEEARKCYEAAAKSKPNYIDAHYNLGCVFLDLGRPDKALESFDAVLDLKKEHPRAHCNRGHALWRIGRLEEALEALRRGHKLGMRNEEWPFDSAKWVSDCKKLVDAEGHLDAALEGTAPRSGQDGFKDLLEVCYLQRRWVDATTLWRQVLDHAAIRVGGHVAGQRFQAARCALLAGTGHDRNKLDSAALSHWRNQALVWLREDLASYTSMLEAGQTGEARVTAALKHWQESHDFGLVRPGKHYGALTPAEQEAWESFWAEVEDLLAKLR